MLPNLGNSPNSLPPARPQSNISSEETDDNDIERLFDPRPQDTHEKPDFIKSAIAAFSKACSDAAAWVAQVLARLGIGRESVIHVSAQAPVVARLETDAAVQAASSEDHGRLEMAAAQKDSVEAKDTLHKHLPAALAANEKAFDNYIRLCKLDDKAVGSIVCPINFREAAVSYAESFIKHIKAQKEHAEKNKEEFWLPLDKQTRLNHAQMFLKNPDHDVLTTGVKDRQIDGPIPENSSLEVLSFMAWRDSRNGNDLPDNSDLNFDAAISYATTLVQKYPGKALPNDENLRTMLKSAQDLIESTDSGREAFEVACSFSYLRDEKNELRQRHGKDEGRESDSRTRQHPENEITSLSPAESGMSGGDPVSVPQDPALAMQSFHAWQTWRANRNYIPEQSNLNIDAAIQYATTMIEESKQKDQSTLQNMKSILDDANDLIANKNSYKESFDGVCKDATTRNEVTELYQKIARGESNEAVSLTQINDGQEEIGLPPISESDALERDHRMVSGNNGPAPEPPPDPPKGRPDPITHTTSNTHGPAPQPEPLNAIPALSTLDTALQTRATTLLNEFFRLYVPQIERGVTDFTADPQYFSRLAASAASDFLNRVNAPDHQLTLADMTQSAAANRIVNEYLRRLNPGPRPGT